MSAFVIHDLFRDTNNPLVGNPSAVWNWPGKCLTAQSVVFPYPACLNIKSAKWRLTWNPNVNDGVSQTAVRLVSANSGPSNVQQIAAFFHANYTNPLNDAVDITQALRSLVDTSGEMFQILHQTAGNAFVGPLIYSSALEVVYV